MSFLRIFAAVAIAWLSVPVHAAVPPVDVPTRGVSQRFLYLKPASPIANVILLPGLSGVLRLRPDGTGETELLESSAASRIRRLFADQGFAVAVVDAPSDLQVVGLLNYRQSTLHMTDLLAVVAFMREHADVPVWLVGHDTGAESAVFAALNFPSGQPVGIVAMAGRTSSGYLHTMPLREVRRPTLVVSHLLDPCTAYDYQVRAFDDLLETPAKLHVTFSGGDAGSPLCTGSGYHQFDGLDADLVAAVADFVVKYNPLVAAPATTAAAVEYYHAGFDHYFLTWVADEIAQLDAGTAIQGWARTGAALRVWRNAQQATSPVCRFYIPPALGNSHFYGRGAAECDETAAKNPSFVLEDAQFMHVVLPAAGVCPQGTVPVYRVFSNRADANHRYTTDRALRDQMVASGWLAEGDGPDLVVMCAPE